MGKINKDNIQYATNMASYNYDLNSNILKIEVLNTRKIVELIKEINNQLPEEVKRVEIVNVKNSKILNKILESSSLINSKVLIDLSKNVEHLYNDSFINLDYIGKNTKIKISDGSEILDNNFTTWAHNRDEHEKLLVLNTLRKDDKMIFLKEEKIIKESCNDIIRMYPNFLDLSKEEQFNIVFEYIGSNYTYDINISNYQDRYKIYAYRSRLLKLITNNNLLNIDCYTISGKLRNGMTHVWNEAILDGDVYHYDITYDMKKKKDISNLGRTITKIDTKVNDLLNSNNQENKIIKDEKVYVLRPLPFENI